MATSAPNQRLSLSELDFHALMSFPSEYKLFKDHAPHHEPHRVKIASILSSRFPIGYQEISTKSIQRRVVYAHMYSSTYEISFGMSLQTANLVEPDWKYVTFNSPLTYPFPQKVNLDTNTKEALEIVCSFYFLKSGLVDHFPLYPNKTLEIFEAVCRMFSAPFALDPDFLKVRPVIRDIDALRGKGTVYDASRLCGNQESTRKRARVSANDSHLYHHSMLPRRAKLMNQY